MEQGHHIIVVDNDHSVREMLHDLLVECGYRVSLAPQGPDAYLALMSDADLLIADIAHEGGRGMELARYAEISGVPAVFMTSDLCRAEILESSGHRVLVKPFRLHQLQAIITNVLGKQVIPALVLAIGVLSWDNNLAVEIGAALAG